MRPLTYPRCINGVIAIIVFAVFLAALSCDEKNDNDSLNQLLLLSGTSSSSSSGGGPCTLSASSSKLQLYNADTHNGNLGGGSGPLLYTN
jgi:hypothetical protein